MGSSRKKIVLALSFPHASTGFWLRPGYERMENEHWNGNNFINT